MTLGNMREVASRNKPDIRGRPNLESAFGGKPNVTIFKTLSDAISALVSLRHGFMRNSRGGTLGNIGV
jgi:hypothetical protein